MEKKHMKYTVVFGSPRQNGNTAELLDVVLKELKVRNTEIDRYDIYHSNIGGCRACLGCQDDNSRICCVIDDDMQPILRSVASSEMLIIAAPVYIWSLPAPAKAVLDRLVYSGCKYYGDDPEGPSLFCGKKLAVITTCGYPIEKGADLLEEEMRRYCRHTGMEYAGMLCERHKNLKEKFMNDAKAMNARDFAVRIAERNIYDQS